jgi:hypothetical protein
MCQTTHLSAGVPGMMLAFIADRWSAIKRALSGT